ncbi:tyrosine-type recombinase/integrase [Pseudonocardia xishanensis]|uniref:Site-specific tyrosine recombinase XerD n=1 Tax=Pseudonocardia xishanensis TaxID=630995 RepID=A0ABP8RQY3_9PSEU
MAERLSDLESSFRRHLRAEGKSDSTLRLYGQSVTFYARWLDEQGRPATLDELNRVAIREWLAALVDSGKAPGTVRTRWKGLHRFCTWLVAEGELSAHPMDGLAVPAVPDKPVPILTDDQLAAVLKACAGTRWYERRDEAVIRFLLDTGCRVSELTGLAVADVDLDHEMAMVLGKGRKIRPVYFAARTGRALDRWLRERRRHRWAHLDAFFLGERGALTPDGVRELVTVRGRAAGVPDLHPHRFRHSFAHDFLLNGGQERDLKRLAGWSSDAMLERYGSAAADMRAREAAKRLRRGDRV